jgi:hypothetical protein
MRKRFMARSASSEAAETLGAAFVSVTASAAFNRASRVNTQTSPIVTMRNMVGHDKPGKSRIKRRRNFLHLLQLADI